MVLILTTFFFITGCNEENTKPIEEAKQQENSIYGTWQVKELWSGVGDGSYNVTKFSNGYTMTFRENNTFSWKNMYTVKVIV